MKNVVDSGFADLSRMNFEVSDEQRFVLDEVDRACRELRPLEDEAYMAGKFNEHLAPIFRKAQLLGLPISRRYGEGQGADVLTYAWLWKGLAKRELEYERSSRAMFLLDR